MKTKNNLIQFLVIALLLNTNISFGQFQAGSGLISLTGAYTIIGIENSNETIDGGGFQIGYEVSNILNNFAFGGGVGYLVGVEENNTEQIKYSTTPLWFYGKYLFGPEKAKFFGSLALGWQFSERQISGDIFTVQNSLTSWDSGVSFGAGTGVNYYFSEKFCGIISYNLQLYNNIYYKEGLAHVFNFGLGFQID